MENEGKKKDVEIKTKSPMWVVILIAVLVIALGCEFVYIRQLKNDNQNTTQKINDNINLQEDESNKNTIETEKENEVAESNSKVYTYEEIKGVYGYKGKNKEELYLKEDGTYNYEENQDAAYGYFGNYIIDGNKILLNQMFYHGSDLGIGVDEKQIKGTIDEDGTITLNLKGKGKLSKKSSEVDKYFYGKTITNNVKKYLEYLEENQ